jgi:hypothetical protein
MAVQPRAGARRLGLGKHLAIAAALVLAAACGPAVPSPSPSVDGTEPAASSPSASAESPEASASGLAEPPPPDTFDPGDVPVFAYVAANGTIGVWRGPVGRPDLATPLVPPIPETDGGAWGTAIPLDARRAVSIFTSRRGEAHVRVIGDGPPFVAMVDAVDGTLAVAPGAGLVAAARRAPGGDDDGVWTRGTDEDAADAARVLAPATGLDRARTAISADGTSVASTTCDGEAAVRFARGEEIRLAAGEVLGFDPDGRLVAHDDCAGGTIRRWASDAARGEPLTPAGAGLRAIVTPDGRTLAVVGGETLAGQLLVRDLATGQEVRFPLAAGGWDPTTDTTDRYVVLRRDDGQGARFAVTYAIVDLVEGWVGYVPVDTLPPG